VTTSAAAARWLPGHSGWIEVPPAVFTSLSVGRFQSQLKGVPVSAEVHFREIGHGRARARLRIGLLSFEARFAVGPEAGTDGTTRIGLSISIANELPVVSGSLDRFAVRQLASGLAEQMLAALTQEAEAAQSAGDSSTRQAGH
jgi:hypothetical protein